LAGLGLAGWLAGVPPRRCFLFHFLVLVLLLFCFFCFVSSFLSYMSFFLLTCKRQDVAVIAAQATKRRVE